MEVWGSERQLLLLLLLFRLLTDVRRLDLLEEDVMEAAAASMGLKAAATGLLGHGEPKPT